MGSLYGLYGFVITGYIIWVMWVPYMRSLLRGIPLYLKGSLYPHLEVRISRGLLYRGYTPQYLAVVVKVIPLIKQIEEFHETKID